MEKIREEVRRSLNGVDVERIEELKAAFEKDPDLGSLRFHATNEWVGGGQEQDGGAAAGPGRERDEPGGTVRP